MFKTFKPNKILEPYVHIFSIAKLEKKNENPITQLNFPSGFSHLGFQFGGKLGLKYKTWNGRVPKYCLQGQLTHHFTFMVDESDMEFDMVMFKPTALWHLFDLNVPDLTNFHVNARLLFKNKLRDFDKAYMNTNSPESRIRIIEQMLIDNLDFSNIKQTVIDYSIELIEQEKGCISIKKILKKIGISERYFQQQFKTIIGIPPYTYCRIVRFNNLFSEMNATSPQNYSTISALFNYYDLSHFSKDFKKYCGMAPSKFYVERFEFMNQVYVKTPFIKKNKDT